MLQQLTSHSRRLSTRVGAPQDVWVYWDFGGREDIERVRDVSMGGLFVETPQPRDVGETTKLNFLVEEGQIRADAIVRHVAAGRGLGLKFTAVSEEDRPHLTALMRRLRSSS